MNVADCLIIFPHRSISSAACLSYETSDQQRSSFLLATARERLAPSKRHTVLACNCGTTALIGHPVRDVVISEYYADE